VFQRSKWTHLDVDISNTTGFVASERKFSWSHFSIILGAGKYHAFKD
jgi:hypothetical protein